MIQKISSIILFSLLLFSSNVKSQYVFHRVYNYQNYFQDYGSSIIQTLDNGYIVGGASVESYDGLYILKLTNRGDTIWSVMTDFFPAGGETVSSIIQGIDESYIISGYAYDSAEGASSGFLLKLDNYGGVEWLKTINAGFNDRHIMHKQTPDGGFIIGGYNHDSTNTYTQVFLIKTDSLGNIQWQKEYGEANFNDNLKSIDLTTDGGYIIGGDFENPATSSWDLFLLKTDSLGNQQWNKYYGTNYSERKGYAISTLDGGYAIVGYTTYSNGDVDGYIVKTDSGGTKIWEKKYGIPVKIDMFKVIRQLPDNSYIVAGTGVDTNYNPSPPFVRLFKLTQNGDTTWTKRYGYYNFYGAYAANSHTYVEDLNLCSDGGFIATGYIINNSLPAKNDLWLLKTDSLGNTCTIDTTTYEGCWSYSCYTVNSQITADSDTVYLTQGATVQFGSTTNFATSWQWDFGDSIADTTQNPQHSYYTTGVYTVQLITNNDYCSDTAAYTITVLLDVGIKPDIEGTRNARFTIYPNPATNQLTVTTSLRGDSNPVRHCDLASGKRSNLIVYNLIGNVVLTTELSKQKQTIDISGIPAGLYNYKIMDNSGILNSGKLVIIK